MCADGPLLPPLSSPTTVDTVATAVTTHHHATAAVAHNFARCYILSSHPVIPSGHHHPVITIPSSPSRVIPSCHYHLVSTTPSPTSRRHPILSSRPVITIPTSQSRHHHHRPPVEPTCWGLTPESLRPDATFILKLIVTEQTSAQ